MPSRWLSRIAVQIDCKTSPEQKIANKILASSLCINKNGCSIFSQDLFGSFKKPQTGEIKVVGTILAPVTNLWDDVWGNDCDVFYNGSVPHPK